MSSLATHFNHDGSRILMTLIAVAARKAEVLIATIAVTMVKRAYYNLNHHIHHNPDLASHPANGYRNIFFFCKFHPHSCVTHLTPSYTFLQQLLVVLRVVSDPYTTHNNRITRTDFTNKSIFWCNTERRLQSA